MAWDEAKREAARQRMAHATAVRMAKKRQANPFTEPLIAQSRPADDARPDLTLTVRRLRIGSFTGLWELCRINPDGSKTVVTDANTKSIMINLARNEILKCRQ